MNLPRYLSEKRYWSDQPEICHVACIKANASGLQHEMWFKGIALTIHQALKPNGGKFKFWFYISNTISLMSCMINITFNVVLRFTFYVLLLTSCYVLHDVVRFTFNVMHDKHYVLHYVKRFTFNITFNITFKFNVMHDKH